MTLKEVAQKKRKSTALVKRREEQPAGEEPTSLGGSSWLGEESSLISVCSAQVFPELGKARLGS